MKRTRSNNKYWEQKNGQSWCSRCDYWFPPRRLVEFVLWFSRLWSSLRSFSPSYYLWQGQKTPFTSFGTRRSLKAVVTAFQSAAYNERNALKRSYFHVSGFAFVCLWQADICRSGHRLHHSSATTRWWLRNKKLPDCWASCITPRTDGWSDMVGLPDMVGLNTYWRDYWK